MFDLAKEIPVTFEPHWADERMLWLTGASILVSGLLGFFAYWNGRAATKIARDTSAREALRQDDEARRRVGLAMGQCIMSVNRVETMIFENGTDEEIAQLEKETDDFLGVAMVEIEMLHPDEKPVAIGEWYVDSFNELRARSKRFGPNSIECLRYRGKVMGTVRRWKNRVETVEEFPDPLLR